MRKNITWCKTPFIVVKFRFVVPMSLCLFHISWFNNLFRQTWEVFQNCNCLLVTLNFKNFGLIFFSSHVKKKSRASIVIFKVIFLNLYGIFNQNLIVKFPLHFKTLTMECLKGNPVLAANTKTSTITRSVIVPSDTINFSVISCDIISKY